MMVQTTNGIGQFNLDTKSFNGNLFVYNYKAATYDDINEHYYFTQTDYSSYGKTFIYGINESVIDSFDVDISCEQIALDYRTFTGINITKKTTDIQLYPTPTTNTLFITTNIMINTIRIFDLSGKLVIQKDNLTPGRHSVDLHHLKNGVYVLQILSSNNQLITHKIIKS